MHLQSTLCRQPWVLRGSRLGAGACRQRSSCRTSCTAGSPVFRRGILPSGHVLFICGCCPWQATSPPMPSKARANLPLIQQAAAVQPGMDQQNPKATHDPTFKSQLHFKPGSPRCHLGPLGSEPTIRLRPARCWSSRHNRLLLLVSAGEPVVPQALHHELKAYKRLRNRGKSIDIHK